MQLQPGALVLNGRYRIERPLGAGGSGEVYLASQTSWLAAPVALKILRRGEPGVDTNRIDNYRARFELEGRLSVVLGNHPSIVRVLEGGDYEGTPVLVMEYMSGGTLNDEIQKAAGKGLPWQRCADVLREAATGLQALHARGYVHRDVKPSNILLDAQHKVLASAMFEGPRPE
jgi:serine/threonine protein kinase